MNANVAITMGVLVLSYSIIACATSGFGMTVRRTTRKLLSCSIISKDIVRGFWYGRLGRLDVGLEWTSGFGMAR
ncbi:hypothetical protein BDV19DRAFT_365520 [Aspergillus venezuelensis]